MSVEQLSENLKSYIHIQLDSMANNTPIIGFMKPLIKRALDKNFSKVNKALDLISDENGNIDVDEILSEMIDNIGTIQPFNFNTSFIGDIEIGGGNIKFNIPLVDKRLSLNMEDLNIFKDMITNKE